MGGSKLSCAARTARAIRAAVSRPPYSAPGHFYSPLTSGEDICRALSWPQDAPGVNLNEDAQLALAASLAPTVGEPPPGPRWSGGPGSRVDLAAQARLEQARSLPRRR